MTMGGRRRDGFEAEFLTGVLLVLVAVLGMVRAVIG